MGFINYTPYEGQDFGAGDFTHDSGAVVPMYDPIEAHRLLAQKEAQSGPPIADTTSAPTPAPTAMTPQGPVPDATPAPVAPPPAPVAPTKPAPVPALPEGATRLKDDEADNDLRKRSLGIVNATKEYPMGSVVPMGDGIFGRVEQHTWTNKDGKRVPGHFRGVTLYKAGEQPTAQEDDSAVGTSYPGDVADTGPAAPPVSKADVSSTTAAPAAKPKAPYKSPWNEDEGKAMAEVIKEYPKLTEEGITNVFKKESGLNPTARNATSNAGGLFQLMPSQEKNLVPGGDITKLSKADQIRLYGEYLNNHNVPRDATDADLGLAQAAPGAIGKSDDTVVYKKGSEEATANKPWQDKDGNVTVGSIRAFYNAEGPGTSSTPNSGGPDPSMIGPNTAVQMGGTTSQGSTSSSGESVQKGIPFLPEDQARMDASAATFAADTRAAQAPVQTAQDAAALQAQTQAADQKKMLDQRANEEAQAQAHAQKALDAVNERQKMVDDDKEPPPFGGNVLAGILAALAQGAGAYAAAINHTDNFAANIINQGLARDNARWKAQHLDKVYGVKDAQELNREAQQRVSQAMTQREIQQRMQIDAEAKAVLAQTTSAQGKAATEMTIVQNQNKLNEKKDELIRQSRDIVHTQNQSGTSSTNGTSWQTKDKPDAKALDITKFVQGPRAGVPGRQDIDDVEHALTTNLAPALGFNYDPKTRLFSLPPGFEDKLSRNPLTGSAVGPMWQHLAHPLDWAENTFLPDQAAPKAKAEMKSREEAYVALQGVMNDALHKAYGARLTQTEIDRKRQEFEGQSAEGQVKALNDMMGNLQAQTENLKSAFPGAEEIYQSRRANDTQNKLMPKPDAVIQ